MNKNYKYSLWAVAIFIVAPILFFFLYKLAFHFNYGENRIAKDGVIMNCGKEHVSMHDFITSNVDNAKTTSNIKFYEPAYKCSPRNVCGPSNFSVFSYYFWGTSKFRGSFEVTGLLHNTNIPVKLDFYYNDSKFKINEIFINKKRQRVVNYESFLANECNLKDYWLNEVNNQNKAQNTPNELNKNDPDYARKKFFLDVKNGRNSIRN